MSDAIVQKACMNRKEKRKAYLKAYQIAYMKTANGKAVRKRHQQSEKGKVRNRRYKEKHPKRIIARQSVNNAIRAGRLPKPTTLFCHECGEPAQQYHHWKEYEPEHWFDVIPVCAKCHIVTDRIIHKAIHIHKVPSKLKSK